MEIGKLRERDIENFKYSEWSENMSKKELVISEIELVPEPLLVEVLDFIHFLKAKIIKEGLDTAIANESSLEKDWRKPEEDEAWQNL